MINKQKLCSIALVSAAMTLMLVNIAGAKIIPTITWNNPADITYGTTLSNIQLDATSSTQGTFTYNPSSGTILSAGTQTLTTTFTPIDSTDYTTATKSVNINVNKATPTIIWSNPADIIYGTALSNIQLNASASAAGTFKYNPAAGTVLSAGTQTLTATFTPTDSKNYTTATASININVKQAAPTITWSNPADMTYGTTLSNTQLDATSSVPGTFAYTPPSGTILSAGTQILDVSFTPTDTANYTMASASVSINVLTPTQQIQQLITFIQSINTSGELDEESSYELIAILNAAETNLDRIESDPSAENPFAEPAELRYFISQVQDKIDRGILSQTNGQTLINSANDVINSLSN